MMGTPKKVLVVDEFSNPPLPNAVASSGDYLGWATTNFNTATGHTSALISIYGTLESEIPTGLYRQLIKPSTLTGGDVIRIPAFSATTSFANAGSSAGYTTPPLNLYGSGKSYFSTVEYNGTTTSYGFYMFKNVISYLNSANAGVYETQHQAFQGKVKPIEVRVYFEAPGPLAGGVSFQIDLIGIDGAVLTGSTFVTTPTTSQNSNSFNPAVGGTSYIGVRITNIGPYTPYIHRIEVDTTSFGQI